VINASTTLFVSSSLPRQSLYLPTLTPGMSGANGPWYFGFGVTLRAPIDRPWNAFVKHTISSLVPFPFCAAISLPYFRANLSAPSLASVPELLKNTLPPAPPDFESPRPPC